MIISIHIREPDDDGEGTHSVLNTALATGADYVKFISAFMELFAEDEAAMERMANAEGRTTHHSMYGAIGAIPIDPE